jgi:hypothetical protein
VRVDQIGIPGSDDSAHPARRGEVPVGSHAY